MKQMKKESDCHSHAPHAVYMVHTCDPVQRLFTLFPLSTERILIATQQQLAPMLLKSA